VRISVREFARRPITRRALFGGIAAFASGFAAKWLVDKWSAPEAVGGAAKLEPPGPGFIDVREFKKSMTVEALNETAEQYFASARNWDRLMAKPLSGIDGAPALLNDVAHLLAGLRLLPGMRVVDFGAGSCWLSRWLTQLGMEAIALDVSPTALKIGQELYRRLPVIGERPPPSFLQFDGHRIDLPDASVDRIVVLDTFHHLLNPDEVLAEMSRILKPGGIAGFSEPGPHHSRSPTSQSEMRNYRVLEDDVDVHRIWAAASKAGFGRIQLAVFPATPYLLTLPEFDEYLAGGKQNERFAELTRREMEGRRVFFMQKGAQPPIYGSRSRVGLAAKLDVTLRSESVKAGEALEARIVVTNTGKATWLPHGAKPGAVWLGCHLLGAAGRVGGFECPRHALTPGDGRPVAPGETLTLDVKIPAPPKGSHVLEFDLVSESVAWFASVGSEPARVNVQVK
jgi:ubiquinone/menaquinone biosynthesis C-methylase UbiE